MKKLNQSIMALVVTAALASSASAQMSVTQTVDPTVIGEAIQGAGVTVTDVTVNAGNSAQFGTYTGFNQGPDTLPNGVVISTGQAIETTAANHTTGDGPNTPFGGPSTPEFDNYANGRVTNWKSSNDVASFTVDFSLADASSVTFNWGFGSAEYPVYTSEYTDAVLGFLDGTTVADQILFDSKGNPVQVGNSFAGAVVTNDVNSAFSNPHGLVLLTTTTGELAAGAHSITFEVGDTNDDILDSAAFLGPITATGMTGSTGPVTTPTAAAPEPSTWALLLVGVAGLTVVVRRRARA